MEDLNKDVAKDVTSTAVNVVAKNTAAKKTRATEKAAEDAPVSVENVAIEEALESLESEKRVIGGPKQKKTTRKSNIHSKESGVVGSHAADRVLLNKPKQEKQEKDDSKKSALWSERNVRWSGVGSLSKGYNIVTEEAAVKWLDRQGVREASPEELSSYYGK